MQATPNTQVWGTTLLDDCQGMALSHLQPHLQKMFENSNLAFLEFAEKAQSSASQIQFMEALTIIQKNRSKVEDIFYRELGNSFNRLGHAARHHICEDPGEDGPLTLLSKEDTDIQVAIQSMTHSATVGSAPELAALRQRLAVLNNGKKLEVNEIPASPFRLANAFHEAADVLVLDHETKLIVYMLFDKFVLSKLQALYSEYNERLVKAGLLPNLKYEVRKNPVTGKSEPVEVKADAGPQSAQPRAAAATRPGADQGQSLGDELFDNIMHLLAHQNGPGNAGAAGNTGQGNSGPAVSNPYPQTEIITAIDVVQHAAPAIAVSAEQVMGIRPGSKDHKSIVKTMSKRLSAEREQLFTGIDRRRLPAADTQIIDLVGMMFEYLLNDEDLPNVAKAELCRLHTPYLKIAIIDKSFFSDKSHPAHELLNTLANAAARWVFEDDLERGIFPSIRGIVQRVINEFVNNIELFSELLGVFRRSLYELVDKASAIEERTRQAAAGKEKLGLARNRASSAIEELVTGHNVPSSIRKMLGDVWLDKLMFIYLREPDAAGSPSWKLATRTIKDIIWSVEPRTTEESQTELRVKLPVLRNQIEQAFGDLDAYGTSDNEAPLNLIARLQEEALCQPVDEPGPAPVTVADNTPDARPAAKSKAGKPAKKKGQEDETLSPEVKAALSRLKEIAFGTWFLIQEGRTAHPTRIKLSWFSKLSGNYMFVDSMGVKSKVWKQNELATLLAEGKARIIDETKVPFVKRALEAIRRLLGGE